MKRPALVALILFAAGPVWAQSSSDKNPPTEPSATTTPPAAPPAAQSPPPPATAPPATTTSIPAKQAPPPPNLETLTAVEARDILGQEVSDASGNDMGLVVDVLFDEKKEPRAVVIDFGGFLGVGTRKIAVDWNLLQFEPPDSKTPIELALTRADIQAAPEYKAGDKTISVVNGPLPPKPAPPQAAPAPPTPPPLVSPTPPTVPTPPAPATPAPVAPAPAAPAPRTPSAP